MSVMPILVLAIGNPSRGDDALGPRLAERLVGYLADHLADHPTSGDPAAGPAIEVIVEQQLVVEHVLDLVGRTRVLFIDAAASGAAPVVLGPLAPAASVAVVGHRLGPGEVLRLFQAHLGHAAPPAELLAVAGEAFELGAPLSAGACARLEQAWGALQAWVDAARMDAARPGRVTPA